MASGKFDWSSVGGRPAPQIPMPQKGAKFDWSSVGGRPEEQQEPESQAPKMSQEDQLKQMQQKHPLIYKLAEKLQGSKGLSKAGDIAGHFNKIVEGTGLPSAAKGFLGTGIEMGRGLANLIPGVNVPKQEMPELNVNPYVKDIGETVGSLGMGLPAYKGYQAAKKGIEAIPHAGKIPELLRNLIAGGATGAAISPEHRGMGASIGSAAELAPAAWQGTKNFFKSMNPLAAEKDLYKAMAEHEMQKGEHEAARNLATHKFGKNNPEALMLSAEDKARELADLEKYKQHNLPEEKMLPGHQLIPEAEYGVKNMDKVLRHVLGEGEPHSQKLSEHIVNAIEGNPVMKPNPKTGIPRQVREGGLREEIGSKYDDLENSLPDIKLPSSPNMKEVEKELDKLVGKSSSLSDEEKDSLRKVLASTHPSAAGKEVNGKAFFRAYRSLRKSEGQQRSKAFGLDPKAHDEWIERANNTKHTYENMEKIINEHFPDNTIKKLHEINHEYSTKVAPLHENPMYQKMLHHGFYKGDMLGALSGTTKGNDILKNLITKNPELSRLVLGHSFASNPEKLLKPNQLLEPYVGANSEIQRLLGFQKEAQGQLETAKKNAEIYKHVEKIPTLSKEINEQQKIAKKLKHEADVTGLTKAEVTKKKIEYEKAQKKLRSLTNRLISATLLTSGIGYIAKKVRE